MSKGFLQRWLPSAEALREKRSLRWLRPFLSRPWLWQINRRTVATGVAIGVFFGFMIPVAQIPFSALFAIVLRANLPVAATSTLVSNPFTYAPIYVAAYRVGARILGEEVDEARASEIEAESVRAEDEQRSWRERATDIGKPLIVGMLTFAVCGALIAYFGVHLLWGLAVRIRAARRRARNLAHAPPREL